MSKSNKKNFRVEENKYSDGYGVDNRKGKTKNKSYSKKLGRALKTKNIDELMDVEEEDAFIYSNRY